MSAALVLVDAHVHVYPGARACSLLDAAAGNFASAADHAGAGEWQGVLLLTETASDDWFGAVASGDDTVAGWTVERCARESCSIRASRQKQVLTIIAGRQIVTAERIEVHAFGTLARIRDGLPLRETVAAAWKAGAFVALPWGVGKWLGARGRMVEQLLRDAEFHSVLPADNGGRPWFWPERRFGLDSRPVLRGSDPLPLPGEEVRVGTSGVSFPGELDAEAPARDLLDRFRKLRREELRPYGPMERASRFFRNQLLLRLRKRNLT